MALDGALGPDLQPDPLSRGWPAQAVDRAALEARLGHAFADRALLERALTHVSAVAGEAEQLNQRLEFLGDRVLGLAVAEMLYARLPEASEGELSHRLVGPRAPRDLRRGGRRLGPRRRISASAPARARPAAAATARSSPTPRRP